MYALFFFPAAVIFLKGDAAPYCYLYLSLCLCETAMGSSIFFIFFNKSGITELLPLVVEAFYRLAGKYSGVQILFP